MIACGGKENFDTEFSDYIPKAYPATVDEYIALYGKFHTKVMEVSDNVIADETAKGLKQNGTDYLNWVLANDNIQEFKVLEFLNTAYSYILYSIVNKPDTPDILNGIIIIEHRVN